MIETGYVEVVIAVSLMVLAIALSRWQRIGTEKELAIGTVRSFVQLVAVGYALELIFGLESIFAVLGTLLIMVLVGSYTAARRAPQIPRAWSISFIAILGGSVVTLGLMLAAGIIKAKAQYFIPLGGMTIGNSMNCSAQVMERLHSDITGNRLAVETALALGKTWREAVAGFFTKAEDGHDADAELPESGRHCAASWRHDRDDSGWSFAFEGGLDTGGCGVYANGGGHRHRPGGRASIHPSNVHSGRPAQDLGTPHRYEYLHSRCYILGPRDPDSADKRTPVLRHAGRAEGASSSTNIASIFLDPRRSQSCRSEILTSLNGRRMPKTICFRPQIGYNTGALAAVPKPYK